MQAELGEREAALVEKRRRLPDDKLSEVDDFVEFLHARTTDRALVRAAGLATTSALAAVWDDDEDAVYDAM